VAGRCLSVDHHADVYTRNQGSCMATGEAAGVAAAIAVGDVRQAWLSDKASLESIFDEIGHIARQARQLIESGQTALLGPLLDRDHAFLRQLAVSSPELDRLVEAALEAGALGAKMSGGGRGGNMIALVTPQDADAVREALQEAGAVQTIQTKISQ